MAYPAWEGVVTPEEARQSWVAWCSDRRLRPGAGTGLSAALVAAGGRRRLRPLRWEGIALAPIADSGYRVARGGSGDAAGPEVVLAGLQALAGTLVTDGRALDQAFLRLAGQPGRLCGVCGQVTRHEERRHATC